MATSERSVLIIINRRICCCLPERFRLERGANSLQFPSTPLQLIFSNTIKITSYRVFMNNKARQIDFVMC